MYFPTTQGNMLSLISGIAVVLLCGCVTSEPTPSLSRDATTERKVASGFDQSINEGEWVYKSIDYACTVRTPAGLSEETHVFVGGGGPGASTQAQVGLPKEVGSELVIDTLVYYSSEGKELEEFSILERKLGEQDPHAYKMFSGYQNVGCGFSVNSTFNPAYQVACRPTHLIDRRFSWFCKNFQ